MNENTEKLVRELAEKLGTTVDHLWSVLVRQAIIQSYAEIACLALFSIGVAIWARFLRKKTTGDDPSWPISDEWPFLLWVFTGVSLLVAVIVALITLPLSIVTILNPEFWALKQILP